MIILFVSDEERPITKKLCARCDILIGCGDLSPGYMDYLISSFHPLFSAMVYGNHDQRFFTDSHKPVKNGFCDVYKGVYVLTDGVLRLKKMINLDLTIAGLSGACSYGQAPFHYHEKDAKRFLSRLKREKSLGRVKEMDIMISHSPPGVPGFFHTNDDFHKPSTQLGRALAFIQPRIWSYGHVHPRYGRQELHFELQFPRNKTVLLNAIPFFFMKYDEAHKQVQEVLSLKAMKMIPVNMSALHQEESPHVHRQ